MIVIPIFNDFPRAAVSPDTVYNLSVPATAANLHGRHAVSIIGYDDKKQAFRMVNSWGENWGDHGFLWLAEGFVKAYATDGWSAVPGGIVVRDGKQPQAGMAHIRVRQQR